MKINIKVICRTDRIYKNNTAPLFIRLTEGRKVKMVSTGVAVNPQHWDDKVQKLTEECPDREVHQLRINSKIEALNKQMVRLEALDMAVSLGALAGAKSKQVIPTIKESFEEQISLLKQAGKVNTAIKYSYTLSSLLKYGRGESRIMAIDAPFLQDFEQFLKGEGNASNSIATKMSVLKATYNKAIKDGMPTIKTNPFEGYKVGSLWAATRKRALGKETVKKLIDLNLPHHNSPYMALAKDIFLFSYYTAGINFRDIAMLRYCDVEAGRVQYTRCKTKKVIHCILVEPAWQIVAKYSNPEHSKDDYIFPILDKETHRTEQQICNRIHKTLRKVNLHLREISGLLGLAIPITTYVARHTYATVLKRSGVDVALISESLGHSSEKVTQIYLDSFENSRMVEAMRNLF